MTLEERERQLRGNLKGFKRAVRRRDIELERLRNATMSKPQPIPVRETPEYREGWRKAIEKCAKAVENNLLLKGWEKLQVAADIRALDKP